MIARAAVLPAILMAAAGPYSCGGVAASRPDAGGAEFRVTIDAGARGEPASGRLVVYLIRAGARPEGDSPEPADAPFFEDPQPMFGVNVREAAPGSVITVDDVATAFPVPPSALAPGTYMVQAVLDMHRLDSSWKREPGNLFSDARAMEVKAGERAVVELTLNRAVRDEPPRLGTGVELVEVRSALLTEFRGVETALRAAVVLPIGYDPESPRTYGAVYEIPGFGGTETGANYVARSAADHPASAMGELLREAFWIVLNPEGPNGHHLFADSANNGPVGTALVTELIPAIEARYRVKRQATARLVRGHSSGGWSAVWLATRHPQTFGGAWASSPDPLDFRRFQLPDIYAWESMYRGPAGEADAADTPSYRGGDAARMTIRQENLMEEVIGPDNTSGQQWDSWQAAFGPRNARGNPAALYDPLTGTIDRGVAEAYRAYDIGGLLRAEPAKYGPIFKQRVRILVGDRDSYYLNEAVALLNEDIDKLAFLHLPEGDHGYVRVLGGYDHGTIFAAPEMARIPREMLEHLRR